MLKKSLADIALENVARHRQAKEREITAIQAAQAAADQSGKSSPIPVYVFYHQKDASAFEDLKIHLHPLRRGEGIEIFPAILGGENSSQSLRDILEQIDGGQPALLVVIMTASMLSVLDSLRLLERSERMRASGQQRLVPIIVRECDWKSTPFGRIMALPQDAKPVKTWANDDEAWVNCTQAIRAVIAALRSALP